MMPHFRMMLALAILTTAALQAQTTCPPLPEGSSCDHFHYHVSVWDVENRMFFDVAATEAFGSMPACEAARAQALRENAALAEFIRTAKVDSSMMANRYSACHCDRTGDKTISSFLDAKARTTQIRARQDAAWSLRQRLLARDVPGAADRVNMFFGRRHAFDRFLGETMPPRVAITAPAPGRVTLLDSTLSAPAAMPPVAANIALAPVGAPPATPATAPAAVNPATPPAATPPPPQPSTTSNGSRP